MQPLVSIIIPVYNQERELQKALKSIEKQTYQNLEVIVVDDGSETRIKNKELRIKNRKIIFFRQENAGAPVARNKGFEMSRGEYVIFWDADIVGESYLIEKMYFALQEDKIASYAYCNFYFGSKKMPAQKFDVQALKKNNYIHSTSLIRRKDVTRWDESLKRFQDWDLWLTMLNENKMGIWIPEYLFKVAAGGTMSKWLPKFAYKKPWKYLPGFRSRVESYEYSKKIVMTKHSLI